MFTIFAHTACRIRGADAMIDRWDASFGEEGADGYDIGGMGLSRVWARRRGTRDTEDRYIAVRARSIDPMTEVNSFGRTWTLSTSDIAR